MASSTALVASATAEGPKAGLDRSRAELQELTLSLLGLSKPAAAAAHVAGSTDELLEVATL